MFPIDREQKILDYLAEHHSASVTELSQKFFISETSIRRDLHKLEKKGMLQKIYGGAILLDANNEVLSLETRQQIEPEAKNIIAQKAAEQVRNGDVIFLDSSSTVLSMIPWLSHLTNLSIITHSLEAANLLSQHPQFKVYVLGGLLNMRTMSIRGTLTCAMLEGIYANRLFVSPKGIDEKGNVYCTDEEEAQVRQKMLEMSEHSYLLCSDRKLGQHGAFKMCHLSDLNMVISDVEPSPKWKNLFHECGVQLL